MCVLIFRVIQNEQIWYVMRGVKYTINKTRSRQANADQILEEEIQGQQLILDGAECILSVS